MNEDLTGIKVAAAKIRQLHNKLSQLYSHKPNRLFLNTSITEENGSNKDKTARKIIHDINNVLSTLASNPRFIIDDIQDNEANFSEQDLVRLRSVMDSCQRVEASAREIGRVMKSIYALLIHNTTPKSARIESPPPPTTLPPKRILVVDDEEMNRRLLQQILSRQGHTVQTAASAEEALTLDLASLSLVITDIDMGAINGLSLAEKIRAGHGNAVNIIVMSGDLSPTRREIAAKHEVNICLEKPLTAKTLLAAISDIFSDK
ncbi:MAG: response regulator [Candidatus Margulisbacteria bacterium]|nr:response regulator [Candidatus Margulisiibacteriota bacterium]